MFPLVAFHGDGPADQVADVEDPREWGTVFGPLFRRDVPDKARTGGLDQAEIGQQKELGFLNLQAQMGEVVLFREAGLQSRWVSGIARVTTQTHKKSDCYLRTNTISEFIALCFVHNSHRIPIV